RRRKLQVLNLRQHLDKTPGPTPGFFIASGLTSRRRPSASSMPADEFRQRICDRLRCLWRQRALRRRWIDSHAVMHLRARQVALNSPGGPFAIARFDKGPSSVEWREFSLDVPLFIVGQLSYRAVFIDIDERVAGIWHGCHFRRVHNGAGTRGEWTFVAAPPANPERYRA